MASAFLEEIFFQIVLEDPEGNLKILKKEYFIQLIWEHKYNNIRAVTGISKERAF